MATDLGATGLSVNDDKFYGTYRGIVVDNSDPLHLGRIKVQVIPYFVGIDKDILPWATPKNPLVEGSCGGASGYGGLAGSAASGYSGYGTFAVPQVNSQVWVFFEAGDLYQPVYDGEAQDAMRGVPIDANTNYPNRKVTKTVCGITTIIDNVDKQAIIYTAYGINGTIDDKNKTVTISTPGGIIGKIDDANSTITITHPSGSFIEFFPDGNIQVMAVKDDANIYMKVGKGNINLEATNNEINLVAGGSVNIQAPETVVDGNLRVGTGDTGTFVTGTGDTVTVDNGIITGGLM